MKKIYLYAMALGLMFASCEDFLTEYPKNKITPDDFFKTEREISLYANSFYEKDMPGVGVATGDGVSDIMEVVSVSSYLSSGYGPDNQGGWSWSDLRNINYFIDRLKQSPVSDDIKNKYMGLAKFWRAKFYFEKVKTFGGVPYYDYCLEPDDEALYKPRDSREFVMDKVLDDLNEAVKYLTDKKDETCTTVTRYVALAMKARVCLHEGTFRKYHTEMNLPDADKWIREAASAAEELINSKQYKLLNTGEAEKDYRKLFTAENRTGVRSILDETIWAQVYDAEFRRWHDVTWKYNSATAGSRWSLTRSFVNTYLMRDGSRFTDKAGYETMTFPQEVKDRDCRMKQTIRTPGYKRISKDKEVTVLPDFTITLSGYHMMKWSLDDTFYDGQAEATNAMPIFRYAEILLIYAEAKAELGEFTSDTWNKTIKLLRERAGVNGKEPETADSYMQETYYPDIADKYLLEIRRERAIELIAEDRRYDDLMRWKAADLFAANRTKWEGIYIPKVNEGYDLDGDGKNDVCFYKGTKPGISGVKFVQLGGNLTLSGEKSGYLVWGEAFQREWDDKKYLRPIPRNVRVINPALEQNPGWEEN